MNPAGAATGQHTLFDQPLVHQATGLAVADAQLADWTSPVDYSLGRAYMRVEVTSKPSSLGVFAQMCMWRHDGAVKFKYETCAKGVTFTQPGVHYLDLGTPTTWFKKNGVWDFSKQPDLVRFVMKPDHDRNQTLLSTRCAPVCYRGSDLHLHVPIAFRASVVLVAPGGQLSAPAGWTNCPSSWGCGSSVQPITIVRQPSSATVRTGDPATFSVAVTGSAPAYQWRRDDIDIPGATGASYTVPGTEGTDSGARFSVRVSNSIGSVTSNDAVLTILPPDDGGPGDGGLFGDTFDGVTLGPKWTATTPGTSSVQVSGGAARLTVPAGVRHDLWPDNTNAVRITQPTEDVDFVAEVLLRNAPSTRIQSVGLLATSPTGQILRFDVLRAATLQTFVGSVNGATGTTMHRAALTGTGTVRIKVSRSGSTWVMQVARGSGPLVTVASVYNDMVVDHVGVWAGNAGANPGFTAVVDSFTVS